MSTSYSASVIYGYALPADQLKRHIPNPLWGKHKFDPNSGEKVTEFIIEEIELSLEEGCQLKGMTRFERRDVEGDILLGILIAGTEDLSYGGTGATRIAHLSEADCARVHAEAKKILDKAGITFDPQCMGYWLVGEVF